jgi:hypothetical protein
MLLPLTMLRKAITKSIQGEAADGEGALDWPSKNTRLNPMQHKSKMRYKKAAHVISGSEQCNCCYGSASPSLPLAQETLEMRDFRFKIQMLLYRSTPKNK